MNGQHIYYALQLHATFMWEQMILNQPTEGGMAHFDWQCLELLLAAAGVMMAACGCASDW